MHQSHIPQCTISQQKCAHYCHNKVHCGIFVMHCGICKTGLLETLSHTPLYSHQAETVKQSTNQLSPSPAHTIIICHWLDLHITSFYYWFATTCTKIQNWFTKFQNKLKFASLAILIATRNFVSLYSSMQCIMQTHILANNFSLSSSLTTVHQSNSWHSLTRHRSYRSQRSVFASQHHIFPLSKPTENSKSLFCKAYTMSIYPISCLGISKQQACTTLTL